MSAIFVHALIVLSAATLGASYLKIDIEPRSFIAIPGQRVDILCSAEVHLQHCRFTLPSVASQQELYPRAPYNGDYYYFGTGLEDGQCGVSLYHVSAKFNGQVTCSVGTEDDPTEYTAAMQLTVARSPRTPDLDVSPSFSGSDEYQEGEIINATCSVKYGRPAANITWFLGDKQIYSDSRVTVEVDEKLDLYTAVQNITRRLYWNDNGKQLKCVGQHLAYENKTNTTVKNLLVRYAPKDVRQPIVQYGFIIGLTGEVVVRVRANPQPTFTWLIGNISIAEGEWDDTEKYAAADKVFLDPGKWKAILYINSVTKDDVEKKYYLKAKNEEGEKLYSAVIYSDFDR